MDLRSLPWKHYRNEPRGENTTDGKTVGRAPADISCASKFGHPFRRDPPGTDLRCCLECLDEVFLDEPTEMTLINKSLCGPRLSATQALKLVRSFVDFVCKDIKEWI